MDTSKDCYGSDVPQTNVDVYVGGKKVIDGYKINSQNSCIKPWGKMGIYRSAQFTSPVVVDYDKVIARKSIPKG